ncbi:hypothetical protein Tco_0736049 [Tanacetum coccineum]
MARLHDDVKRLRLVDDLKKFKITFISIQIFYDHVNLATRRTIDQSAGGKLRDKNTEESWALIEDLDLYDNERWNDPRDFAKPVKAISLTHDVPKASDRRLIELENQVQRLMEAHLNPKPSVQVNKIASSCEICSGAHDTQYCMKNPEQAFVDYASSRTDEAGFTVFEVAVLEVLAHAPMYNAILDKYVESLELGERITMSIFGVKEIDLGVEDVPYWTTLGKRESYEPRPSTDGIGVRPPYYAKKDFLNYHLPGNGKLLGMPNSTLLRMS